MTHLAANDSCIGDRGSKKTIYAEQGAQEYFLYDPEGQWLKPALQGFRLVDGSWQRLVGTRLRSEVLEMDFFVDQDTLRVCDLRTGQIIVTRTEELEALRISETARLHEAEAEVQALREQLRRLQGGQA